jgi:hypothetical protein
MAHRDFAELNPARRAHENCMGARAMDLRRTLFRDLALFSSLTLAAVAGCHADPPIDPKTSAQEAAVHAGDVVRQAGSGVGFLGDSNGVLGKMFAGADDATAGLMGRATPAPLPAPLIRQMRRSPVFQSMGGVQPIGSFLTSDEQFDETARDVEVLLRDRLLAEANIESKTDSEVTYLLKPDPTCRPLPSQADGIGSNEPNASCANDLTKLQVRLVTSVDGDGIRLAVLLGPARDELSVFVIHSDLLAWEIGFVSAKRAVDFANSTLSPNNPDKPYPFTRLEGRVRFALQKLGPKNVKVSFGILEAVDLEGKDAGGSPMSLRSAKSDPLFALAADGVNNTATVGLALGQTDVTGTWDPQGHELQNGDLHVSIGGLYGEATFTEGKKEIDFKGAGIGQTFVAVRGTHIFDLDFNAAAGRKMDLVVKSLPGDLPRFELTPRFDLTLAFNLGAVAADFSEPPPAYASHEMYNVRFDGATPAVIEAVPQSATFAGGLKVVAGALALSAASAPAATVTVAAGQCLTGQDPAPPMSHEILGHLKSTTCP